MQVSSDAELPEEPLAIGMPACCFRLPALLVLVFGGVLAVAAGELSAVPPPKPPPVKQWSAVLEEYCTGCHDDAVNEGGLDLEAVVREDFGRHPQIWEKVIRKLRARHMPPAGELRPDSAVYDAVVTALETSLDVAAAAHPDPGRTATFRRLSRFEYQNAIRDLLALEMDATALLPADASSHGFDSGVLGDLSPTLLERYVSAAQKISRLAVGGALNAPIGETLRIRPDRTQEEHVAGLPLGTRGGVLVPYTAPLDGAYDIEIRLARDRNEHVEGLKKSHELLVLLDREPVAKFTVKRPEDDNHEAVDAHLKVRIPVPAGPHKLGVTFVKTSSALLETKRQPYDAHFNKHRHPRLSPAVYQISITGPYAATGPGDTPSRRRIFVCHPTEPGDEEDCARRILATLMRRAYRGPVSDEDLERPLALYRATRDAEPAVGDGGDHGEDGAGGHRAGGDFEAGIETALSAILVSPRFLFRIERDPVDAAPNSVYRIGALELASRLSFFLWSSLPDDELLEAAIRGDLERPENLEAQVRRMLADSRSRALVTHFAGQWLHLRNLAGATPDQRLFPDFDDNLRQALRRETELLFESVLREDRSVLDLLRADYTFLNERLARHYDIPHVYGSRFRRVPLEKDSQRGGLLRHGSILTVTSYATRTSPVLRGRWVLENLLGSAPPPPPPDVPALKDKAIAANLSLRERLAEHRANPACAGCHELMDPIGFALENFDAVGRWRRLEAEKPVDASGHLPGGSDFVGVAGLEASLLERPEIFLSTLVEKLLTFALGRGVEYYDAPAVRAIVRQARADGDRFSSIVLGVVTSPPFQMRRSP